MQKQIITSYMLKVFYFHESHEHGRAPKSSLLLKKHHGLYGFVGSIPKQCVLITEDARTTASIVGDILLSKSITFVMT